MTRYPLVLFIIFSIAHADGNSGKGTTQRLAIGAALAAHCATGGLLYTIYGDADEDGSFSASDVLIDQQAVCGGASSADAEDMVFVSSNAKPEQCENGGSLIFVAVDVDHSDSLTPGDSNLAVMLVCKGDKAPLPRFTSLEAVFPK